MSIFFWSKALWVLLAPSHLMASLVVLTALFALCGWFRLARVSAVCAAAIIVVAGILPVNILMLRALENRYPRPATPARVDGVLVLGSGQNTAILRSRGVSARESGDSRIVSAVELARLYPQALIVFSGGSAEITGDKLPEAESARHTFAQMGLAGPRLLFERRSRNTYENILYSQRMVHPAPGQVWLLATGAVRMPRAMDIASQVGWPLTPWPTEYQTDTAGLTGYFSLIANLSRTDFATHEWLGLMAQEILHGAAPAMPISAPR